jgi:hypothetical protein
MANIELDGANKKITVDSGDLTLDIPGDIILDADGGDLVFADGGTNLLKVTNSSSDVVVQPQVDAKDIKFNQYDGRTLLDINDGGFVGIANGATGPGQLRLYEDTDNGTNYSAFQVGTQSGDITYTLPTADGSNGQFLSTNGSGTLSWGTVSSGVALDDVSTGDAASTLATSAGDITIDAQGNDTDIIFKGTDGGADTTFLTIDGSAAGASAFNSYITSTAIYGKGDDNTGIQFDGSDVITLHTGGTNRMTMAANGDIHFPNTSGSGYFTFKTASSEPYVVHNGTATGTTTVYMFKVGGTEVGTINRTSSGTSYNTSSDYRLKENETAITDGITRVKQLKPYKFNFKVDPDTKVDGFFAHEVSGIVPEAISGEKDGENMQGIDQSKLVPLLTGALQEAITKIETLETKVAALEG